MELDSHSSLRSTFSDAWRMTTRTAENGLRHRRFTPCSGSAWRQRLRKNQAELGEVWVVFDKKGAVYPTISYNHVVEEALCCVEARDWACGRLMVPLGFGGLMSLTFSRLVAMVRATRQNGGRLSDDDNRRLHRRELQHSRHIPADATRRLWSTVANSPR